MLGWRLRQASHPCKHVVVSFGSRAASSVAYQHQRGIAIRQIGNYTKQFLELCSERGLRCVLPPDLPLSVDPGCKCRPRQGLWHPMSTLTCGLRGRNGMKVYRSADTWGCCVTGVATQGQHLCPGLCAARPCHLNGLQCVINAIIRGAAYSLDDPHRVRQGHSFGDKIDL